MEPSNAFGNKPDNYIPKSSKTYYLKYYDTTVAEIYEEVVNKNIVRYMEILNPSMFFDKHTKQLMTVSEFNKWVVSRVRPISQIGFNKLLSVLGLNGSEEDLEWLILIKTRAVNVKDRIWLAFSEDELYEEFSPWSSIAFRSDNPIIETISRESFEDNLNLFKTKSLMNVDGACEKDVYRINGNLAIVKTSLQHNTYDCLCEELIYNIADKLGVNCSPAGMISDNLCYSVVDDTKDLISGGDLVCVDYFDLQDYYSRLSRIPNSKLARLEFLRMCLFDLLTRQLDRNITNFSFYKFNNQLLMYRLYDNGLALFSSSKYRDSLEFSYTGNASIESIKFVCKELSSLGVDYVFDSYLTEDYLTKLLEPYSKLIESKNGNSVNLISSWIIRQQEFIGKCLEYYGLRFYM